MVSSPWSRVPVRCCASVWIRSKRQTSSSIGNLRTDGKEVFGLGSIYQSIEILSKEKGIDPQIVIDAVKDAMLVAARKHFKTTEDLVADFNERTGALEIYGVRKVVETVQDATKEISLEEAKRLDPGAEMD